LDLFATAISFRRLRADLYGSLGLDIPEAPRGGPGDEAGMARQKRHLPQRGRAGGE
jgi:hypothetical protein